MNRRKTIVYAALLLPACSMSHGAMDEDLRDETVLACTATTSTIAPYVLLIPTAEGRCVLLRVNTWDDTPSASEAAIEWDSADDRALPETVTDAMWFDGACSDWLVAAGPYDLWAGAGPVFDAVGQVRERHPSESEYDYVLDGEIDVTLPSEEPRLIFGNTRTNYASRCGS